MTETPGSYGGEVIPQPSQQFTRPEQLELLLWHPLFTGKCPRCGRAFGAWPETVLPAQLKCCTCGWQEREAIRRLDRA